MRAKSINNLTPTRTAPLALASVCLILCSIFLCQLPQSYAQEIDFQRSIDSTSEAIVALDVMASDCLSALDSTVDDDAACDSFMAAIDGELMADYLDQCRTLKTWRDEYVDETVVANLDSNSENNEEMLRRLISIEFNCGENTLLNRTQFVFSAFNRLRRGSLRAEPNLRGQLSRDQFEALDGEERRRLQNALQSQRNRSLRESEQQFNDLELQLIRQQIPRPNSPN